MEKNLRSVKRRKAERRAILARVKVERGCEGCGLRPGEEESYLLDFDHLDPREKHFNIAMSCSHSLESLLAEAKKCRVLCKLCHARRHRAVKKKEVRQLELELTVPASVGGAWLGI